MTPRPTPTPSAIEAHAKSARLSAVWMDIEAELVKKKSLIELKAMDHIGKGTLDGPIAVQLWLEMKVLSDLRRTLRTRMSIGKVPLDIPPRSP